jgi:hypothetical protein
VNEATLRKTIVRSLRTYSGFWYVTHGGQFQQGGLPDIIGCYGGWFFGLEVKLPGKEHTLTPRQSHALKAIREAGGKAKMVTSVSEAMDFVFDTSPLQ